MSWIMSNKYLRIGRLVLPTAGVYFCPSTPLKCLCHVNNSGVQGRPFFSFPGSTVSNRKKEYHGRKLVGFSMDQLFSVVSDVENYHKFVPWCTKSKVYFRKDTNLRADLVIGFPPVNERYTSQVTLVKPHMVRAECRDGRLFKNLLTVWRFSPGLRAHPDSCVVDFHITFEVRSMFHVNLMNVFFKQVALQTEDAFLDEVTRRYGKASIPVRVIDTSTS